MFPQQDVIGQNLVDIALPESAAEITDCLRSSAVLAVLESNTMVESTVSQFRQFCVKFKPAPKCTSYPVSVIVHWNGPGTRLGMVL